MEARWNQKTARTDILLIAMLQPRSCQMGTPRVSQITAFFSRSKHEKNKICLAQTATSHEIMRQQDWPLQYGVGGIIRVLLQRYSYPGHRARKRNSRLSSAFMESPFSSWPWKNRLEIWSLSLLNPLYLLETPSLNWNRLIVTCRLHNRHTQNYLHPGYGRLRMTSCWIRSDS